MAVINTLFECLDLLDLWQIYGQTSRVAQHRQVSISKVSRRCHDMLSDLGRSEPGTRGLPEARPEDCDVFPSGAYPEGLAPLAEVELRPRGLWRHPSRRSCFDVHDWMLGMRNQEGLCYRTSLLLELIPESQELIARPSSGSSRAPGTPPSGSEWVPLSRRAAPPVQMARSWR